MYWLVSGALPAGGRALLAEDSPESTDPAPSSSKSADEKATPKPEPSETVAQESSGEGDPQGVSPLWWILVPVSLALVTGASLIVRNRIRER